MAKPEPSMDEWLKEAKQDPKAAQCGMFLTHNGVVRITPKAQVREGVEGLGDVAQVDFSYDAEGLEQAVKEALKEQGVTEEQFGLSAVSCNGISECKAALLKKQKGLLKENFIEGMACEGGCIGGPACLSHNARNTAQVNAYGRSSAESSISDAIKAFRDEEKK